MATTVGKAQWKLVIETAKQNLDDAVLAHQKAQVKLAAAQFAYEQAATAKVDAEQTLTALKQASRAMFGESNP